MPKVSPGQFSFIGGEWSPLLFGRVDSDRYPTALKICLNYVSLLQGPLTRRSGTRFVAPSTTAGSKLPRLRRFKFSTVQAYMLEFTDQKLRIYKNRAAVLEANKTITNITQANPAVVSSTAHGFSNGEEIEISGVVGMTQVNRRRFTVAGVTADTFELQGVDSTGYAAYISGGNAARVYTVATPYVDADMFEWHAVQSADVLYIAHPDYAPRKLTRTGDTAWILTTIDFLDGPYMALNPTATTLTPSATSGNGITITASAATGINNDAGFLSTDVGRLVRIRHSSTWGYAKITAVGGPTSVTADVKSAFGATSASAFWRLGLWSDTTGYPATVGFIEDRLCWGGSRSATQRVDMSKSSDYENMAPTAADGVVAADNAIAYTLNSSDVQTIRWIAETDRGAVIGTESAEWILRPSTQNEALTPTNAKAVPSTYNGSSLAQPVTAGEAVVYVQAFGRKVREVAYLYTADKFKSPDLTVLAEHITASGLKQLAYQKEPQPIIWAARNDGVLLGCTYERDAEANVRAGWHRHILGGRSSAQNDAPQVVSVDSLPSPNQDAEDVWVAVKRYINGQTVYYVEYISEFFDEETSLEDAFFVDSGLTLDNVQNAVLTMASEVKHVVSATGELWTLNQSGSPAAQFAQDAGGVHLSCPGTSGNFMTTLDAPALDITGDVDLRGRVSFPTMPPTQECYVIGKQRTTGNNRSYDLRVRDTGHLRLSWSVTGATLINVQSTVALSVAANERIYIRATLDVDNGSGQREVKFYTSSDGVTWTQLGATVTTAGVTSIFSGTAPLEVGGGAAIPTGNGADPMLGNIYYAEVRDGIDGPVVAKFDASSVALGDVTVAGTKWLQFSAGSAVFAADDVGQFIHYRFDDDEMAVAKIDAVIDSQNVVCAVQVAFPDLGPIPSGTWHLTTTGIDGLWHLEGETLAVLADGAPRPDETVSQGVITLAAPASKAAAGHAYNSDGQILRIEAGSADGTALGKTRRAHRCAFLFQRTLGWLFGSSFDSLSPIEFRQGDDPMDEAVPLFTGVQSELIEAEYDFENEICWRQNQPLPGTLLAVAPQMHTQDR